MELDTAKCWMLGLCGVEYGTPDFRDMRQALYQMNYTYEIHN